MLLEHEDDPKEIFFALAVDDIATACDLLRPVWDGDRAAEDGYVSLEVDPTLAYDTRRARSSRRSGCTSWVDRPNLYVKIPATAPGLPAIEEIDRRAAATST